MGKHEEITARHDPMVARLFIQCFMNRDAYLLYLFDILIMPKGDLSVDVRCYSHCVPFSRCMRYSTSTSFVSGITQSCSV